MSGTKIRTKNDQRQYPTKKIKLDPDPITFDHTIQLDETSLKKMDLYYDHVQHEQTWMDEKRLAVLIEEMVNFAINNPGALKATLFLRQKGISNTKIHDWRKKWPQFDEAYKFCKNAVGDRLFVGGVTKQLSEGLVTKAMPIHDEEWKEESERQAKMRLEEKNAEQNKTVKVMIERYTEEKE